MSTQLFALKFRVRTMLMAIAGAAVALNWLRDLWAPVSIGFVLVTYSSLVIAVVGAFCGLQYWKHCFGGFALSAAAFFMFFQPEKRTVNDYLPTLGCPESLKVTITNWLVPNLNEGMPGSYASVPVPVGATDPDELFPRRESPHLYQFTDLGIDPISIGLKVFGLGSPPPDPYICTGCIVEVISPALAIEHCISTFFVGICGAMTVCWLRRPQDRG